ncbi:rRNA-processing protein UTP23 homolog [Parasteatoda tepidariorum]|uniref:rRNA-processing protein UTP23 homolog n=1 Tax=Parasteatoda tepidariorum TaxID=114398 RepID=UPI00077F86E1|nr:rRNA-processing protein UTP23 homolog [Parasteatoda tepidariorum]
MKITRQKHVRRYLKFYKNNYQFRSPYQILIDATFCNEALQCKLNIKEQVPKYLEDPNVKLFTTPCVIAEVEMLASEVYGAMLITKSFKARICGHEKNPVTASECLYSMIENGNPDHYMIATQERELSEKCRQSPGVPLLYVKYNAVNLEKPSVLSAEDADMKSKASLKYSEEQIALMQKLKAQLPSDSVESKKTTKRKAKGPNPLSCKKKSKVSAPPPEKTKKRKRHKRNKNKIPSVTQNE